MRTVFLGTSAFAATILDALAGSPHVPALVITRPDRPQGRGRHLSPPPVAQAARALGLELDQPDSVNDPEARARIAAVRPDAVCVCAYGALIKEPLLGDYWMINVHPSLLPRWRGAAPIERAIMAGDGRTGVSIMRVTAGLDSGPVCTQASESIAAQDTFGTLAPRLEELGGRLLLATLDERPACHEQDDSAATYADKIAATDRDLDPSVPAAQLERVVRALTPHIGARIKLPDGHPLGVREARVVAKGELRTGELGLDGPLPVLGCAEGGLALLAVQPPGGRAMSGEAFLRGHLR